MLDRCPPLSELRDSLFANAPSSDSREASNPPQTSDDEAQSSVASSRSDSDSNSDSESMDESDTSLESVDETESVDNAADVDEFSRTHSVESEDNLELSSDPIKSEPGDDEILGILKVRQWRVVEKDDLECSAKKEDSTPLEMDAEPDLR